MQLTVMDSFRTESWSAPIYISSEEPAIFGEWEKAHDKQEEENPLGHLRQAIQDSSGKTKPEFIELLKRETDQLD